EPGEERISSAPSSKKKSSDTPQHIRTKKGARATPAVNGGKTLDGKAGTDDQTPSRPDAKQHGRDEQHGHRQGKDRRQWRQRRNRSIGDGTLNPFHRQIPLLLPNSLKFRKHSKPVFGRNQPRQHRGGADHQTREHHIRSRGSR